MTEQKATSAIIDETTPAGEESLPHQGSNTSPGEKQSNGTVLGVIAIVIALALTGALYFYQHQQNQKQIAALQSLTGQLTTLQQQTQKESQRLTQQITSTNSALDNARQQQLASAKELNELRSKITSITDSDIHIWLISQADYLVKLAGRKLWSDQDVATAAALLKSADTSLANMNDPRVIDVRRALTQDISDLSAVSQIDYDGIILKLNQLASNVDNLPLADNDDNDDPMESVNGELSSSIREWRQNLVKSWHNFMDDFITIRRRGDTAQPLLAPNQDIYLRENIRSRLLIAAQAVPRHQDEIYKQSVDTVSAWVRAWFDTKNPNVKVFLSQLDDLNQQSISMDIPTTLRSQSLLDKLMETRVRNLLSQPGVTSPAGATQTQQGE